VKRVALVGVLLVAVLVGAVAAVAAWRRDGADAPVRIPARDVPFALLEGPGAQGDAAPDDGAATVTLFFVSQDALVPVSRSLSRNPSARDVLDELFAGPTRAETASGLSSALGPEADVTDVAIEAGRAAVNLGGPLPETPDGADRARALAQVVFTLTELPGVDEVRFLLDGEAVEVPVGDGTLTRSAVTRADYPVAVVALVLGDD
jgi:spore germination protein GerM